MGPRVPRGATGWRAVGYRATSRQARTHPSRGSGRGSGRLAGRARPLACRSTRLGNTPGAVDGGRNAGRGPADRTVSAGAGRCPAPPTDRPSPSISLWGEVESNGGARPDHAAHVVQQRVGGGALAEPDAVREDRAPLGGGDLTQQLPLLGGPIERADDRAVGGDAPRAIGHEQARE